MYCFITFIDLFCLNRSKETYNDMTLFFTGDVQVRVKQCLLCESSTGGYSTCSSENFNIYFLSQTKIAKGDSASKDG